MKSTPPRRRVLLQAAAAAALLDPLRALAQAADSASFPNRAITLYCPWSPGGPTDVAMRALAEAVAKVLGHRIVIENKPGAGGALGAQTLALTGKPDGYTLTQTALGVLRLPYMAKTSFEPLGDLTWIVNIVGYEFGTMVRADAPWKTWPELIAYARANPDKLAYGSPGVGTSLHLTMDDIAQREKIRWTHVPYKGSADSYNALLGKQVDIVAGTSNWELVQAGRMRLLVTWGPKRNRRSPEIPNLAEIYGIISNSPWGIAGPKGMDPRIVKLLHDAFRKALDDPQFLQVLDRVGMEPFYMNGEDFLKWARQASIEEKAAVDRLGLGAK